MYKLIRKDFLDQNQKCIFCSSPLSTGVAYFLEDKSKNKIVYAGKTCCKKELKIDNFNEIPDFTRFKKTSKDATHHNLHLKYENIEDIKNKTSRKKTALEYLLLREEILEIPNLKYHILTDIYAISKIRELESSEIEHIINIEKNAPKKLKLFNLLKVYSYLYHLKIALTYEPNNRFLNDVKNHLIKYSELSDKQTDAINKTLKNHNSLSLIK